ncbi:MAG: GerMN domain-containing protein [Lachnospiraceae bacterium]|nr:GerMN domain-containing protein [Lachnospiraceae bacterium]
MGKKICIPCLLSLLCMLFLAGCTKSVEEYDYQLYYINKAGNQLVTEGYNAYSKDAYTLVGEFLDALATQPAGKDVLMPGFDVMKVVGYSEITQEGYVTVNFSAEYSTLPDIKEILCRAAIVKTLCQIDGVAGVKFEIDGEPVKNSAGEDFGYMSEETFVDNMSGETGYKQTISVLLYFANKSGRRLVKLPVDVTFDGTISLEQLVVQQLINGPQDINGVDGNIQATVPNNTIINQITVREQICYIDLSIDFLTALPGISREAALYSVVNSLVELPDINKVQFSIDGDVIRYYGDSLLVFDVPLERNLEIVKE